MPDSAAHEATASVALNEVQCEGSDWIEVAGLGALGGSLAGLVLTDAAGVAGHEWAFPDGAAIEPGGLAFVVAEQLPFGLSCGADTLELRTAEGELVDAVALPALPSGQTWGRLPDGSGDWARTVPTPWAANEAAPGPPAGVALNEVRCSGGDWLELHNPSAEGGWLDGLALSDQPDAPLDGYTFPVGTWIEAGGYLALGSAELGFGVACGADALVLADGLGAALDQVSVPEVADGRTWGRLPDGAGDWTVTLPTPGASNQAPAAAPAGLALNEVRCAGGDWVELHNASAKGGWLDGLALSDDPAAPEDGYVFPADTWVDAGGFVVVSGEELGFGVACGADTVALADGLGVVLDQVAVPALAPNRAWGRLPDGAGAWSVTTPTPGAANAAAPVAPAGLALNEVRCSGGDWVELHNASAVGGWLDGLALSDDPAAPEDGYVFPADTWVDAGGSVVVTAEELGFGVACGADTVALVDGLGVVLDQVDAPASPPDQTWGRLPDGTGGWAATSPTPGAANAAAPEPPAGLALNEVRCSGGDWVELHNPSAAGGWLDGLMLGDGGSGYAFPPGTWIASGGFLVIDGATLGFGIACGGDAVALTDGLGAVLDQVDLPVVGPERTWGRLPDGAGVWEATAPTPGAANQAAPVPPLGLALNEVRCAGGDWVELHNPSAEGGWLDGLGLTDDPAGGADYLFPAGTWIGAGGFQVVDEAALGFGIACGAETLALVDGLGAVLDQVAPPAGPTWASWGRLPDGAGAWADTDPTPGAANQAAVDPSDALFDPATVPTIDLSIGPDAWAALEQAPYLWVEGAFQSTPEAGAPGEVLVVALRLKGKYGSFRNIGDKAAFKIAFDHPDPEGQLAGLRNLTLNNMVQDSSTIHEHLSYALYRAFGVPAPRLGYAWVRVNGVDYGLYCNVETYDEVFLARHFDSTWHLLEGQYGVDVTWNDLDDFDVDVGPSKEMGDLEALAAAANAPPGEGWLEGMEAVADVEELVRTWAVEVFTGHWDGYAPTINNYYLHSDDAGRFTMHPWGTDQTFASWWGWFDGKAILWTRCLATPACRDLYGATLSALVAQVEAMDLFAMGARQAGVVQPWQATPSKTTHSLASMMSSVQSTLSFIHGRAAQAKELVACLDGPDPDADGDGWLCTSDCDDDPAVHPGAVDHCDDGIDQDCNGKVDDGGGCPECAELWRGERRYLYCPNKRDWAAARAHCEAEGDALGVPMDLAIVTAAGEAAWIHATTQALAPGDYWVGLSDLEVEGTFAWWDGQPESYENWNGGEPNDWGASGEDCAGVYGNGKWNDWPCTHQLGAVCEELCAPGTDVDQDGADACDSDCDDGDSALSPAAVDVCGDGLDQDCSGVADDAPGCGVCTELWRGAHRYLVCEEAAPWAEARALCQAEGADLVILDGGGEAQWLDEASGAIVVGSRWIGLTDLAAEGDFVWWDGSALTYDAWSPNEPNDGGGAEDCAEWLPTGLFNDIPCSVARPAICEDLCGAEDDGDGDGATLCAGDCDDDDPTVGPDAVDLCGDGVDQDCSGVADDGPDCEVLPCQAIDALDGFQGFYCQDPLAWAEARALCASAGGDLAWFDHLGQQLHVRALVSAAHGYGGDLWFGLDDQLHEGAFVWSATGEAPTWSAWIGSQPDDAGAGEDCGWLPGNGSWNDAPCDAARPSVCRVP